jgi:quercetin dioxygenase-like cupin family protein
MEQLDRDIAIEIRVVRPPHFAHATFTYPLEQAIAAELTPFFKAGARDCIFYDAVPFTGCTQTRKVSDRRTLSQRHLDESRTFMTIDGKPRVLGPKEGKAGLLGVMGVRFMIDGADSGGGFSLVEHPMPPRCLGAPLHRHSREDEYSYVVEGKVGALLGDDVVYGEAGDLIFKPRGQWHSFWNAGDEPARILEIISPAGFEKYFEEIVDMGGSLKAKPEDLGALAARYGLEVDIASIPELAERFGLRLPSRPSS